MYVATFSITLALLFTMYLSVATFIINETTSPFRQIIENKQFWESYLKIFKSTRIIHVNVFSSSGISDILYSFSDGLLMQLHQNVGMENSIFMRFRNIGEQKDLIKSTHTPENGMKYKRGNLFIKTANTKELYFMIVWDVEILDNLLDLKNEHFIVVNPKGIYVFLFFENDYLNYDVIEDLIHKFGSEFQLLNVIVEIISVANLRKRTTLKYNLFHYEDNVWGKLEVVNSWSVPTTKLNFCGYPMKVSIFPRNPTAIQEIPNYIKQQKIYENLNKYGGYAGQDGCVLAELANYLNFSIVFVGPNDQEMFGTKLKNGTLTGSLGDIVYKRADFSANSRFLMPYESDEFEFTATIANDKLCVVVPKSDKIPEQLKIFYILTVSSWIAFVGIFLVSILVWTHLRPFWLHPYYSKTGNVMEIVAVFLSIPILDKKPRFLSQKFFFGSCLLFNVIFSGIFRGNLFTSHGIATYYPDINTLEELDDSGLRIMTTLTVIEDDPTKLFRNLKKKTILKHGNYKLVARFKNVSILDRMTDAKLYIKSRRIEYGGEEVFYIVPHCLSSYYFSYIVPRGSSFLPAFNFKLTQFRESGLLNKWYYDMAEGILMDGYSQLPDEENTTRHPFSLGNVQIAFYVLGIGVALAFCVFVVEITYKPVIHYYI